MDTFRVILAFALGVLAASTAVSAERPPARELIYGSELMTDAELDRYRDEFRRETNDRARESFRERHRERLRLRARERGVTLIEPSGVLAPQAAPR